MKHFIAYDKLEKIIWGVGKSEAEAIQDAIESHKRCDFRSLVSEEDFNAMLCTKETYEHLYHNGFAGTGEDKDIWVSIIHNGKHVAVMYEEFIARKGLSKQSMKNGQKVS